MEVCHINATLNPRSLLLPPCPALSRLDNPWHVVCSSPPQFCSATPAATLAGVVSPLLCVGFRCLGVAMALTTPMAVMCKFATMCKHSAQFRETPRLAELAAFGLA